MKRFFRITVPLLLVTMLLVSVSLASCGQPPSKSNEKLSVVCTIFPQYDWTLNILGDDADDIEVSLLLDEKVDLHNYQPSVDDIVKISNCDLFIYVGGESDAWVEEVLSEARETNEDMVSINLLDALGDAAKPEEVVEGMEEDAHDDHGAADEHDADDDHGDSHEAEEHEAADDHEVKDEHVWLSLKNAQTLCAAIEDALSALDAENAGAYQSNLAAYVEELSALDAEYRAAADAASVDTLLFGDRFPFRYLTDDYGLDYYAAFVGCSAETEASFETIIFLAEKTDELGLKNILVTESADQSIAKTIRDNTADKDQRILALNAMQSIARSDIEDGASYILIMQKNLEIFEEALK